MIHSKNIGSYIQTLVLNLLFSTKGFTSILARMRRWQLPMLKEGSTQMSFRMRHVSVRIKSVSFFNLAFGAIQIYLWFVFFWNQVLPTYNLLVSVSTASRSPLSFRPPIPNLPINFSRLPARPSFALKSPMIHEDRLSAVDGECWFEIMVGLFDLIIISGRRRCVYLDGFDSFILIKPEKYTDTWWAKDKGDVRRPISVDNKPVSFLFPIENQEKPFHALPGDIQLCPSMRLAHVWDIARCLHYLAKKF